MNPESSTPTFSVIIPTRDRAVLFGRTLDSVLAQDIDGYEIIVVDDGSSGAELTAYQSLAATHGERVRWFHLVHRQKGHGPAYSRNFGAAQAHGHYLCFLDDDDLWIDPTHLRRCRESLTGRSPPVDLYFTDQEAYFPDGRRHPGPLWISGVESRLPAGADHWGNRPATAEELLQVQGFAHLNCSIYRRKFYESISGMDETLRYENDHDVYLRAIDAAKVILYNPAIIARHHIPDATRQDNVSTAVNRLEKKVFQLRIADKAILNARRPAVQRYARHLKGTALKHMADTLRRAGRTREALFYMREALLIAFTVKWALLTLATALIAPFRPPRD